MHSGRWTLSRTRFRKTSRPETAFRHISNTSELRSFFYQAPPFSIFLKVLIAKRQNLESLASHTTAMKICFCLGQKKDRFYYLLHAGTSDFWWNIICSMLPHSTIVNVVRVFCSSCMAFIIYPILSAALPFLLSLSLTLLGMLKRARPWNKLLSIKMCHYAHKSVT